MKGSKSLLVFTGIVSGCVQASIIIGMLIFHNILFDSKPVNSFSENGLKVEDSLNESSSSYIKTEFSGFFNNKQSESAKEIIIYNGVTIDQGIKSNENIDNKAIELTKNANSDRERAKILYTWVGSNIKYDDAKAEQVLGGNDIESMPESGAISAFTSRSGICFDKACLYVAMSRAIGLKVRLIGGQAFDGEKYVGHAWNQVYLNDENTWINVDTTFYNAGNYFDSNLFDNHNMEELAGEW